MNLYLDCEFNGFGGELIAMSLIDGNGRYFYEVLPCNQPIPWVAENVMPHLVQDSISLSEFQCKLRLFLNWYPEIHVIADWVEDISLFTRALVVGAGQCLRTPPMTLQLWESDAQFYVPSETPHYALSDARALMQSHQAFLKFSNKL